MCSVATLTATPSSTGCSSWTSTWRWRRTRVILTTERIVSNDQIRRTPDRTRIPFFTVDAVVEAPFGCAPHECYGLYEPFFSHLDHYAKVSSQDPVKGPQQYLEEFYYEPKSWPDYLSKLGMDAVLDASRRGRSVHND